MASNIFEAYRFLLSIGAAFTAVGPEEADGHDVTLKEGNAINNGFVIVCHVRY
jgi:hypothetical protein